MADIEIVKIKVRRGTDSQRRSSLLDQGELGYTTDTNRLYVGNGVLSGGKSIASKIHPPLINVASLVNVTAEIGDLVFANNIYWQLTAADYTVLSNWANVSPRLSGDTLAYDTNNTIYILNGSLTPYKLNSSFVNNGITINSGFLQANLNASTMVLTGSQISIKNGGVGVHQLNSNAFGNGLSGGSGRPIGIKYDPTCLYLKFGDTLSISAFPANSITFNSLDPNWIGAGLIYDGALQQIRSEITDVDGSTISKDISGRIALQSGLLPASNELAAVTTDTYGRVLFNRSSIYDTVSCLSSTDIGPLSSLFNGTPNQSLSGALANIPITIFTVLSSNSSGTVALNLSSAGFLMFEGNTTARQDGKYVGRFAIPIFAY